MSPFWGGHRTKLLFTALVVLLSALVAVPASAVPGVPPDITGIAENDQDIDPGETRFYKIFVTGYDDGGAWTFSGDGLTATVVRSGPSAVRLMVVADATASGGMRDLTATNPDGLSDTLADAIFVTGDNVPGDKGDITGHVFDDVDGNGVEDGADTGLAGVSISVTDANGSTFNATTDGSGDYTVTDVGVGDATVTHTTPAGTATTTGNTVQVVTVVIDSTTAAAAVGFQQIPSGDLAGHVFADADGNGVEDGSDTGLVGVVVTVTDAASTVHTAVTDASGDFTLVGLATGDADLSYAAPANGTLTTGNDTQTVNITDGGLATAADVGYQLPAGTPPDITSITENDQDIDPGETRFYRIAGTGFVDGATYSFSGSGLDASAVRTSPTKARISITATLTAEGGPRDLTVTNPDGLSDTFVGAITVTGDNPPPDGGEVMGHVFTDDDGNGIEDGTDAGLAGVAVSFTDANAQVFNTTTDGSGDFSLFAAAGAGTLTVTTPSGYNLTTGNDVQALVVIQDGVVTAAPVGYEIGDTVFVEVTSAAGIDSTHTSNDCGPPIGVGAAFADIDNDGDQDFYRTDKVGDNKLYRNDGDTNADGVPEFTDITAAMSVANSGTSSFATVFADIDNDGDQDLFVADETGNKLFENQLIDTGSLGFVDISATAGLTNLGRVETAAFGDVDNDGYLDLYIAKHMSCAGIGDTTDALFHNNGDGSFSDWTTYLCGGGAVPCDVVSGLGFAPGFLDMDDDGDLDIYLVNDNILNQNQPNKMIRNDGSDGAGGWLFTEVGALTGTDNSVNGMGLGIADYNNDGVLDFAFSDAAPGHLLMGDGGGTWTDVSGSSGVSAQTSGDVGWGTIFLDYDNDGFQDLFFAVGPISGTAPLANSLLHNNQDGTFTNVSAVTGMGDERRGRSTATADVDGDGWVDMYIGNYDDDGALYRNRSGDLGSTNNWLTVTVEGTDSNRDGIGTKITLDNVHGTQLQVISSGSSHGGGSEKAAFFGLGATNGGALTIEWPNGEVTTTVVSANQKLHFVEPTA